MSREAPETGFRRTAALRGGRPPGASTDGRSPNHGRPPQKVAVRRRKRGGGRPPFGGGRLPFLVLGGGRPPFLALGVAVRRFRLAGGRPPFFGPGGWPSVVFGFGGGCPEPRPQTFPVPNPENVM